MSDKELIRPRQNQDYKIFCRILRELVNDGGWRPFRVVDYNDEVHAYVIPAAAILGVGDICVTKEGVKTIGTGSITITPDDDFAFNAVLTDIGWQGVKYA